MTPGQPSSRLDAQAAEQRWAHVLELCAGEPIEFIRYDAHGPHVLIGDVHTVRRPRISEDASVPPDTEENGTSRLLLIDLLDVDAGARVAADVLVEAIGVRRSAVAWIDAGDLSALAPRLPASSGIEVFEQVSAEGVVLARADTEVVSVDVDIAPALREGVLPVVVCVNLEGLAEQAATNVTVVEAGGERVHLAAALADLRHANLTLGRAQRGKSQAAAATFVQKSERRIVAELEEQQRVEKEERDAWIASLLAEIAALKGQIAGMEDHWARRLVRRIRPRRSESS
jgi:hypothetical protein